MSDIYEASILYVEDDTVTRSVGTKLLQYFYSDVVAASNGIEALEKYQEFHIDVVVTDIAMPLMDGFELIKALQNLEPKLPVVIVSAYKDEEHIERAQTLAVSAFVSKPFKKDEIVNAINCCLDNGGTRRTRTSS